ncbi:MAG: alpha-isopropylmalate synthase regulatory domain-containing protein, partial [Halobacteria archaeon]|nr:alpha-isopropylmalate synthase regulatory domain-containing protein [Halobacteria archaeon]
ADDEVDEITKRVKSMGSKGKRVSDADVFAVAESVMSSVPESEQIVDLKEVNVSTGKDSTPMASIRAEVNDEEKVDASVGVGPVDAALNAVRSVMDDSHEIEVTDFHIDSISGGSDAVANVYVGIEDEEGREANANASSEDITVASVEAVVDAINHLVRKQDSEKRTQKKEAVSDD